MRFFRHLPRVLNRKAVQGSRAALFVVTTATLMEMGATAGTLFGGCTGAFLLEQSKSPIKLPEAKTSLGQPVFAILQCLLNAVCGAAAGAAAGAALGSLPITGGPILAYEAYKHLTEKAPSEPEAPRLG